MPDSVAFGFLLMMAGWEHCSVRSELLKILMINSDTLRLPEPIGRVWESGSSSPKINPGFQAYIDRKYHKVVSVVDFMASCGAVGAEAVVSACEVFATGSARQWLKVAGDAKADLVDDCLQRRPGRDRGVVAEFGTFVGYSCTRMSWRSNGETPIITLESDAVHVMIAQYVVSMALCSPCVEVVPGMAHDTVRRMTDDWGSNGIVFAFMDHRGTRFHVELMHLEALCVLAPDMKLLEDNTLKPGAPVNLWHFDHCKRHCLSMNWSLAEFVTAECEDWMSVSECMP